MPYILSPDRKLVEQNEHGSSLIENASSYFLKMSDSVKAHALRSFLMDFLNRTYQQSHFEIPVSHQELSLDLIKISTELADNVLTLSHKQGGLEGLLNYTLTRLFNEAYPHPRYKDFNAISGILTSLIRQENQFHIDLLGMLTCCRDEYYRKYAAPYEDLKEKENGAVKLSSKTKQIHLPGTYA